MPSSIIFMIHFMRLSHLAFCCASVSSVVNIALHQTEVKILSEILENTKASNATTSEQLDALKETVDTLQKEIFEFENKKSKN